MNNLDELLPIVGIGLIISMFVGTWVIQKIDERKVFQKPKTLGEKC